ncbi:type II toxin-antitoxin system RelE/ParE family toxin [Kribbella sp. NPDC051718]|uniref:type II toxin-antitoxin system RelE/ParE family toxin n=1 Tax=Kribbella sp. NPDC051718 TaxID=3155168 RepID=UPI003418D44F
MLGEPYTKQLDGKLRELRFWLEQDAMRISYWIATDRRVVLLTVFRKSRMRETREVDRARRAIGGVSRSRTRFRRLRRFEMAGRQSWDEVRAERMAEPGAERLTTLLGARLSWAPPCGKCVRAVGGLRVGWRRPRG